MVFRHHLPCSALQHLLGFFFVCFMILRELRCNGQVFYRNVPQSGFVWCFSHDSPGVMGWGRSPTGLSTLSCHIRGHETCVVSLLFPHCVPLVSLPLGSTSLVQPILKCVWG